ncbi:unnamed protein product [Adineta steineri]|uniref:CSD domain-containing protein n=1 Tax=Adineta steineri TaxID=433720 RepID=A0A814TDH7_9BILA|nr:unnamed protein product [Adineta steineri]CAF1356147.1 unnamed protein product [Adineta steineri]
MRRFYADTDELTENNLNVRHFDNEQDSDEDDDTFVKRLEYLLKKSLDLSVRDRRTGTLKWFNVEKGFAFITPDDGAQDLFADFSAIGSSGYRSFEEGQKVAFDVTQGPRGQQAYNIVPI